MGKLLGDIFTMNFDIVMPLSSCILAILLAAVLFSVRYLTFLRNRRRYVKRTQTQSSGSSQDSSATIQKS